MATHSSILAWEIPRTEEPGGLQSMRLQRARHDQAHTYTHTHTHTPPNLLRQVLLLYRWFDQDTKLISGGDRI